MKSFFPPVCLTVAFMLSACGGGGSGGPTNGNPDGPASAGGSLDSNTFVLGDILYWTGGHAPGDVAQFHRLATASCPGSLCTVMDHQMERATFDFGVIEPDGGALNTGPAMRRNGVTTASFTVLVDDLIVEADDDDLDSIDGYGAWGDHNVGVTIWNSSGSVIPMSAGYSIGTDPASGSAAWRGAMVGTPYSGVEVVRGRPVIGDTTLTVNFRTGSVDVLITGIVEPQTGQRYGNMQWAGLPMSGGAFRATGIDGRFYGPNHEEAGGVVDQNGIAGAFSVKRQ